MIKIHEAITISRPPEEVFAFLADLNNIARWNADVESFSVRTPGPTRTGSRFVEHTRIGPSRATVECEVTEFTPSSVLSFNGDSDSMHFEFHYSLQPTAGATTLTLTGQVSPKGIWALLAPLITGEIRSGGRGGLVSAKEILEKA